MKELEKAKNELKDALERYKIWNEKIEKKEILWRNTPEEIEQLDKEIKAEVILPIIAKIKWIQLTENI